MKAIQRIISGLLTLCMVVSMLPMQTFATDESAATSGICGDNLTWTFDEGTGTLTITGSGAMYDYEFSYVEAENTIPWGHWAIEQTITSVVLDDRITEIGDNAFGNTRFYSIDLPDSLTRIGCNAFFTSYLEEIVIPDSVTYIGEDAFAGCYNLESAVLPTGITEISDDMFYECHFISSVLIPEGVEHIGAEAFYDCSSLEEIILPESLKTIGAEAFRMTMTSSLKTITIPANVTSIGNRALGANFNSVVFEGNAPSLADDVFEYETLVAYYPEGNSTWTSDVMKDYGGNVEWKAYTPEGDALHSHSYTAVVTDPTCWNEGYTDYICICGDSYSDNYVDATGHSFGDWYETKAATEDAEGEERRDCANCEYSETQKTDKLTHTTHSYTAKVTAPTCTEKGSTTYTCECGNSYVGDYVDATGHDYDDGVVTTAPGCEAEGIKTFTCVNDKSHTYTESVAPTGHAYDSGIVTTKPGCETEGVKTFTCANDKSHTYTESVAATGHTYSSIVTNPTCTNRGYTTYTCACGNSYVDNYVDPFDHSYTVEIIKSTCTEKGYTSYTCQCGHSYIDGETDPTGHTMEEWCIVTEATCETAGEERRECGKCDYFETRPISATGHSMGKWVETKAATYESEGEERRDCENCNYFETKTTEKLVGNVSYRIVLNTAHSAYLLYFEGYGDMENYSSNCAPWHEHYYKTISCAYFQDGLTSIGNHTLDQFFGVEKVRIANTVTSIGDYAFSQCAYLYNAYLPDNLSSLGVGAFQNCERLTEINIPTRLTHICDDAFQNCSSMKTIILSDNLESIGEDAFYNCVSLTDVYYSGSEEDWAAISIESGNDDLLNATIHYNSTGPDNDSDTENDSTSGTIANLSWTLKDGVLTIEGEGDMLSYWLNTTPWYYNRYEISAVVVAEGVTSIGDWAFEGDYTNLRSAIISKSVNKIGSAAFQNCDNLTDVYYSGTEAQWASIDIGDYNEALLNATIHYNRSGPDEISENSTVRYFREWDAETQTAYWGVEPPIVEGLDLGSQVTEETDTSFLANVDSLVGTYVLVETRTRDDGMIAADILLSVKPLETKNGTITAMGYDTITIDDVEYPLPESVNIYSIAVGDEVMYHLYNGVLVGINGDGSTDPGQDDSGEPEFNYPEFDYEMSEEDVLRAYLRDYLDEFVKAYNDPDEGETSFADEVNSALLENAKIDINQIKKDAIKREAEKLKEHDEETNRDQYLTYTRDAEEYADIAYKALATYFYEVTKNHAPELSSIDITDTFAGSSIVSEVINNISTEGTTYTIDGEKVTVLIANAFGPDFGQIHVRGKEYVVTPQEEDCREAISALLEEMKDLGTNAAYSMADSVYKELLGKSLSSLAGNCVGKAVENFGKKFDKTLDTFFKEAGLENILETVNKSYSFYEIANNAIRALSNENVLEAIGQIEKLEFKKIKINNWAVDTSKKAMNKAIDKMKEAFEWYLKGTLIKHEESFLNMIFGCPIEIAVYNADGEQIGFVSDDDCWYTDGLVIRRQGEIKIISMLVDEIPRLVINATDYGTMSCCIEECDDTYSPMGRLLFYDVPLVPGQIFELVPMDDLNSNADCITLVSDSKSIYADRYIHVDERTSVSISCNATNPEAGMVYGAGIYATGDIAVMCAYVNEGYEFVGWFDGETLLDDSITYEFITKENRALTAKFTEKATVNVEVYNGAGGTSMGSGTHLKNSDVTLTAFASDGYAFDGWYCNDVLQSSSTVYSFQAEKDIVLETRFVEHVHSLTKPVFIWEEDYSCCAVFACKHCDYGKYVTCDVSSIKSPATESEDGKTVYTATAKFGDQIYTDTKTVTIPATGHTNHTAGTTWFSDSSNHWHKCTGCDEKLDLAAHSGGTATCVKTADCSVCGTSYGDKDSTNHSFTKYVSDENATCKKDGTKTAKCDYGCGKTDTVTDKGSKLGHKYKDGKCVRCGVSWWNPDTGDKIMIAVTALVVSGAGILLLVLRRKNKK